MANKYKMTVIEHCPKTVHINKNGRPVKLETAHNCVAKEFPNIKYWNFMRTDHSILATEQTKENPHV